jgi:mannan endo-1,4-beta-mannosidase
MKKNGFVLLAFIASFVSLVGQNHYIASGTVKAQPLSQKQMDDAMTMPLIHNVDGPNVNTELWNDNIIGKANTFYFLALTAHLNPNAKSTDGKLVRDRVLEDIRNLITVNANGSSNEPSCRGDLFGWKDVQQVWAILLAKRTPEIWSKLSVNEVNKLNWLMRAFAVAGNYFNNYRNWPNVDMYQTYGIGKTWNPNHNDGYVGIMIAEYYYFGGASAVDKILADFRYDTYIAKFQQLGFHNIVESWTAAGTKTYPVGKDEAFMKNLLEDPDGKVQYDKGHGMVYGARMPFVFGAPPACKVKVQYDPVQLYKSISDWMFPVIKHNVFGKSFPNTVADTSLSGAAYVLNGGISPESGQIGMCREFQVTDGFPPNVQERSDARYCWLGWMMHVTIVSGMMSLGVWPTNQEMSNQERRMFVGSQDLIYKLHEGYHGFSLGHVKVFHDYQFTNQGYWFVVDIWNHYIKKRFNFTPEVIITSPSNHVLIKSKTVVITAGVQDNDGNITKVAFYDGSFKLGEVTKAPYSYTWENMPAGSHSIVAKAYYDGSISKSETITIRSAPSIVINEHAILRKKKEVLAFLHQISGKKILSGEHNERFDTIHPFERTEAIYKATGKYPALFGIDFTYDYRIYGRWKMIYEAVNQWKKGAVINIMWHACIPTLQEPCLREKGIEVKMPDSLWTQLITNGTALNKAWKARIDQIVPYLQYLQEKGVVVLWRPLHEMNQGAFWWGGRPGAEGTRKLYQITHDYMVKTKGLKNLIWVWDVQDLSQNFEDYNLGNKYWDVLALDFYSKSMYTQQKYNAIHKIAGKKPFGIGECAIIPTPAILKKQPLWSFFMAWSDLIFKQNKMSDIIALYNDPKVLTLDQMPGWK